MPEGKEAVLDSARTKVEKMESDYREGLLSEDEKLRMVIEVWQGAKGEVEKLVADAIDPFGSVAAAQVAGVGYARAVIDSQLDNNVGAHRGYFIRVSSSEQIDGTWVGHYQLHRNDNPVAFRRVACEDFRGNTPVEAEVHAMAAGIQAVDADVAAGKL